MLPDFKFVIPVLYIYLARVNPYSMYTFTAWLVVTWIRAELAPIGFSTFAEIIKEAAEACDIGSKEISEAFKRLRRLNT